MNRFDRVTSLLLLLQTRSVVTAQCLAQQFDVSERTIYRDIRTLENAGVPIGSEPGVGYFLQPGYRLPPVCFTLDEAAALMLGEKLVAASLDSDSRQDFQQALNKVKAVMDNSDKDYLASFAGDLEVLPTGGQFPLDCVEEIEPYGETASEYRQTFNQHGGMPHSGDRWLRECRQALLRRQVVELEYQALSTASHSSRQVEPIGLFYYSWHWHLIGWCRLRQDYRDFRLDRIQGFRLQSEQFSKRDRLSLQAYLKQQTQRDELEEVELLFTPEAARFVAEQRYMFGFVDEQTSAEGVRMRFLTSMPDYMARWLLQYTQGVEVLHGAAIKQALREFAEQLQRHWNPS